MSDFAALAKLGWQAYFQQQLSLDDWEYATAARVVEQHRSQLTLATVTANGIEHITLAITESMPALVVGDWVLLDKSGKFQSVLERKTLFQRKAAGTQVKPQLISANIDTAFIVSSMNEDFNLNRLERFLALVNESGAEPVVILSKADEVDSPEDYVTQVQALDPGLAVEAINGLDADSVSQLDVWMAGGTTIGVLGSSGVGKSTLINTLLGEARQSTSGIREDDAKGRHTTTRRSLITLPNGALILDTPGMREIQLAECKEGIATTFADIEELALSCKYGDCQHQSEPGCAVLEAVEQGDLDERRLLNYQKILREEALNSASLMEKRAKDKALGKFYKHTLNESRKLKGRPD